MKKARESVPVFSIKLESDPGFQQKAPAPVRIWAWLASSILLCAVFVICAVFYVWLYVQQIKNGYRLSKAYEESELLSNVQRKLTIEWSRFRDPQRLEEIGRNQFGLAPPRPDQKVVMR
jgi:cell division protein FtsL